MGWAGNVRTIRRLLLLALGGTLGIAIAVFVRGEEADTAIDSGAQKAAQTYERSRRIETEYNCAHLAGIDKLYCADQAARRAREAQRQEYDTAAQEKNMVWTKASATAAGLGVFFTIVTILALFLNYVEQTRANQIQFLNFMDARRRARQTLAHARGVSHSELRPYVFVDKIVPEQISERNYRIIVWFRNFGQTPARNLETIVTPYVTKDLSKLRKHRPRADRIELGTAAPNGCRRAITSLLFSKAQWEAPAFDRAYGVLRVKYSYTDDSGTSAFEESFDYDTDPVALTKEEPMFYLLTNQRIKNEKRHRARQGDLLPLMRKIHARRQRAERKKAEE